jgi:RNA polymerase sigma-70 factor (sigma-E family)
MVREADQEFDEFVVAAWPRLHWTGLLLTGDRHLAEDLAQTALARTYVAWRRVRREDALAYARKILVNANIDRLRRRRLHEVPEVGDRQPAAAADSSVEDRDQLLRLLGVLSTRERKVLVLRHYFDLSETVVAEELGISVGTVKSTSSRALAKLRARHAPLPDPASSDLESSC